MDSKIYAFDVAQNNGQTISLSDYRGKVLLIVNTASECGFTPQYTGLQALHEQYQAQGLAILAFPCNQFGGQEPGDNASIATFCQRNYGVSFPVFDKIEVNGDGAHPLYVWLKRAAPGILGTEAVKWNFTKFLVDRQGNVIERFAPNTAPAAIASKIAELL